MIESPVPGLFKEYPIVADQELVFAIPFSSGIPFFVSVVADDFTSCNVSCDISVTKDGPTQHITNLTDTNSFATYYRNSGNFMRVTVNAVTAVNPRLVISG